MPAPSKPPRTRTTGTPPVVLVKWYDVAKWLLERVDSFPKNQRFIFGQRIAGDALGVLELLVEAAAAFRDRVLHHAVVRVIQPICEKRFIEDGFASRPGKGTYAALERAKHFARSYRYALKCDIRKYFPSIDLAVLLGQLGRVIGDRRLLALVLPRPLSDTMYWRLTEGITVAVMALPGLVLSLGGVRQGSPGLALPGGVLPWLWS